MTSNSSWFVLHQTATRSDPSVEAHPSSSRAFFEPLVTMVVVKGQQAGQVPQLFAAPDQPKYDLQVAMGWNIGRHPRRRKESSSHHAMFPEL